MPLKISLPSFPKTLLALLATGALGLSAPAHSQDKASQSAKESAAAVAGQLANMKFNIDSSKGTGAIGQPNTREAMNSSLSQFQSLTGVTGTTQLSNHATSSGAGSRMRLNVDGFTDYQCNSGTKRTSVAAVGLNILGCEGDTLKLEICGNTLENGVCSATGFLPLPPLKRGEFRDWNSLKIGVACNSSDLCRITLKGSYEVGGSDATLKQKSEGLGTKKGSTSASLSDAITAGNYSDKMLEYGVPLKECSDNNEGALDKGVAVNCGSGEEVNFKGDKPGAACKPERRCIRKERKAVTATKTCTRSFELTERVSQLQYNNYASCEVVEKIDPKTGERSIEDGCLVDGNDMRAGKSRISEIAASCSKTGKLLNEDGKEYGDTLCLEFKKTEYWLSLASVSVLSQIDRPTPVIGACATVTGMMESTCPGNNWFGRVLPVDQCTASVVDELGEVRTIQLDNNARKGCGVCLSPVVSQACYGAPHEGESAETCNEYSSRDNCVMTMVNPLTTTDDAGGLVTSQEETYQCEEATEVCVEWEVVEDACYNTDMAQGLDKLTFSHDGYAAFASALVAAGTLDSVGRGVDSSSGANPAVPKIFNGEASSCHRPTGGLVGDLLNRNCCSKDLERPKKGQLIRKGCDTDDVELAAARRSSYTKYIGDYCSKKSFWGQCLRRTETYCVFPGMLPRIVHEQGRAQLLAMATSDTSGQMKTGRLSFNYYDSGNGSWSPEVNINGNRVKAWQWPSYCQNPEEVGKALLNDPNAPACPGMVTTWFATCTTGQCDNFTESPEHGALTWDLMNVNPLEAQSNALNRFTIAKGGCTLNNKCDYEIKAWPLGVGGKVVVSKTLTWQLFSESQEVNSQNVDAANTYRMSNVGDFMFRGYSQPGGGGSLPATVRMDFSSDGGQTWTTFQLPTNRPNQEMNLGSTGATVIGSCDLVTNMCGFSMTGTTTITAKPWGSARRPDCSGFTAGQLSAMDFGKMDLSEWLATVIDDATKNLSHDELVQEATAQFTAYNSIYSGGEVSQSQSSNRAANFARIVPSEGFGPFNVRIAVSGIWPEITGNSAVDTDIVNRVTIDWGDCSPVQELVRVQPSEGNGFRGTHTYKAPDSHACLGNPETNVTHKVTLKAYTSKSGVQERTLSVENAWSKFPGGKNNNDFESEVYSADPAQGAPSSPVQDVFKSK